MQQWGEVTVLLYSTVFYFCLARRSPTTITYCGVIRIRRSLVSILEICFSTLQLHAAKTIQARPAQHRGRATWHLMQSRDVVWKCRKAGCMAILKSRVPQRRGCPAVRRWSPASNTSTCTSTLHRPSSTFRQPSLACGLAHA
jgi:hypothetical protein